LTQLFKLQDLWPEFDVRAVAERVVSQLEAMTPLARQHLSVLRRIDKHMAAVIAAQ
jgi:hypothetical protein